MPASLVDFAWSTAAILATPGPANTLLATAGAMAGVRPSLRLIPVEWLGYAVAITFWIAAGRTLLAAHPAAGWLFRAGVVVFLFYKAHHLWRAGETGSDRGSSRSVITVKTCFVTAVSNPKGLIFATFVFPAYRGLGAMLPFAVTFSALAVSFAFLWIALGTMLGRSLFRGSAIIARVASITFAAFAMLLSGTLVSA